MKKIFSKRQIITDCLPFSFCNANYIFSSKIYNKRQDKNLHILFYFFIEKQIKYGKY